ncbi:P-loop NTPase family protein [Brevibacillus migulae]|uniref:DNA topology modulation protein FlaR n=1 Tax=Brevibacillus migulae TaxID=1644114 RepID=UPI00196A2451|nr:DNA topology modulation protein FlaR [Brevibacillus migulae]
MKKKPFRKKRGIILKENFPNRIHIIGSVGSGKTTLAKKLSCRYHIPYYELDNVVWKRHKSGDRKRSEEERDEYLEKIVSSDRWIIEGVHYQNWVYDSIHNADVIIFLDTPYWKRICRITRRFLLQKLGVEKANYKPTFKIFVNMFRWNASFEQNGKPKIQHLQLHGKRVLVLKDNTEIDRYYT